MTFPRQLNMFFTTCKRPQAKNIASPFKFRRFFPWRIIDIDTVFVWLLLLLKNVFINEASNENKSRKMGVIGDL